MHAFLSRCPGTVRPILAFLAFLAALLLLLLAPAAQAQDTALRIGSKRFTESYILAELLAQTARAAEPGAAVELKQGLGNTAIVQAALRSGAIDVYPEYLGTIEREILGLPGQGATPLARLNDGLRPLGLAAAVPLGFNNGYALALRGDTARRLGLTRLSQLAGQPQLRAGLSHEFLGRADGWPGLARRYGLRQQPQGLDHGLAYQALQAGQIDLMDIYSTDAQIAALGLAVLEDDAGYFPRYDAVLLHRLDLPQRHPRAWAAMQGLAGRIHEADMIAMNAQAELRQRDFAAIAAEFLRRGEATSGAGHAGIDATGARPASSAAASTPAATGTPSATGFWPRLWGPDLLRLTGQHLTLVLGAVALAALLGIPLALALHDRPRWREAAISACALLQTVPSLALLALLIWALDRIGPLPAVLALTLYALLPILRNTAVGLAGVPVGLVMAATALGLTRAQVLRSVQLPLAAPVMLAGLRTATSLSVGTATIAAFIGAGGYGERIVTGLALNDQALMLAGALPAAALALLLEGLFALAARTLRHGR